MENGILVAFTSLNVGLSFPSPSPFPAKHWKLLNCTAVYDFTNYCFPQHKKFWVSHKMPQLCKGSFPTATSTACPTAIFFPGYHFLPHTNYVWRHPASPVPKCWLDLSLVITYLLSDADLLEWPIVKEDNSVLWVSYTENFRKGSSLGVTHTLCCAITAGLSANCKMLCNCMDNKSILFSRQRHC